MPTHLRANDSMMAAMFPPFLQQLGTHVKNKISIHALELHKHTLNRSTRVDTNLTSGHATGYQRVHHVLAPRPVLIITCLTSLDVDTAQIRTSDLPDSSRLNGSGRVKASSARANPLCRFECLGGGFK